MVINEENSKVLLSVVSGTYNRRASLERMVVSVRNSFSKINPFLRLEFSYEIVLVDGGSTDGTLEWCKEQKDIRLIEHGELRGAVKAFNDGAFAARGTFVVLGNDDITFVGDTLVKAVEYMIVTPTCGIGCFYQDRNGRDWHVEEMPVIIDGRQSVAPYGQVCIVPKVLGDQVGWWGNYLKTYGGDNELSCRIYELGYEITPLPNCRIHDSEEPDLLRQINNIDGAKDPRASFGQHPDSWAWGNTWSKGKLVGPVIKDYIDNPPEPYKHKKVLYLPIYEQGWDIQKEQKRGLREALGRENIVLEYDYVGYAANRGRNEMLGNLVQLCNEFNPDIILTQIHNTSDISPQDMQLLKQYINALWINWNGDFWPDNLIDKQGNLGQSLNAEFDIVGLVNRDIIDKYKRAGINAFYWQIGWEPDGRIGDPEQFCDVIFLANGYSKERQQLVNTIRQWGFDFKLYGNGWPKDWASGQTTYDFRSGCKLYRGAKIALGDSQWPDSGFVSNRIFQILCTGGCALFHQRFAQYEQLGLIDKVNCVMWNGVHDLHDLIKYYLANPDELKRIADAGEKLALDCHSFDSRVEELNVEIDKLQNKTFIDWR